MRTLVFGGTGMVQPLAVQANLAGGSLATHAASFGNWLATVTSYAADAPGAGAAAAPPHSSNKLNK